MNLVLEVAIAAIVIILGAVFGAHLDDRDDWDLLFLLNAVVCGIAFYMLAPAGTLAVIQSHPANMIKALGGYILLGIIWAIVKFARKAGRLRAEDMVRRSSVWRMVNGKDTQVVVSKDASHVEFDKLFKRVPAWIAFWPWVLMWDLFADWLKSFFEWLASLLRSIFKGIFSRAAKDALTEAEREIRRGT